MNRFAGTIICMMAGVLAMAQQVYELDMPVKEKTIYSGHLKLGGSNPSGERIEVNSYYMSVGGKPVIPVMGEFHYSRYPECQWEEEILKMKAGGVTVIPTYVFWSIHEEKEGVFNWEGNRNLRKFLSLCQKHNMWTVVRIGPFCHGEIRNGGLPDWLFAKPLEIRILSGPNRVCLLFACSRIFRRIPIMHRCVMTPRSILPSVQKWESAFR